MKSNAVAVFGGGGAKSLACAGAWRAMREAGLEIAHIVGTSMGAVIGAALASGATYDEVVIAARSLSRRDVAPIDPLALVKGVFAANLFKPDGLRRAIERLVPATRFEALQTPFTLTATDLDSGELLLFGAGGRVDVPLHDALYASCALPLYFPPARIDGRRLADGACAPCSASRQPRASPPTWSWPSTWGPASTNPFPGLPPPFPAFHRPWSAPTAKPSAS